MFSAFHLQLNDIHEMGQTADTNGKVFIQLSVGGCASTEGQLDVVELLPKATTSHPAGIGCDPAISFGDMNNKR
jgi:hypothetical protein